MVADGRNQLLTRRTGPDCSTSAADETYVYDAAGNIASATGGGLQTTYTYAHQPQLLAPLLLTAQTLTVTTDSAGLTTGLTGGAATWSYLYDQEGRLASVCKASSCAGSGFDRVDAGFDGAGHRTRITTTTAGGTVTVLEIVYQGDAPAQERVNGVVTRTYATDDIGRITRFCDPECTPGNPVYLVTWNAHGDALSIGRLDPATGVVTVVNRFAYATWGSPTTTVISGFTDLGFRYLYVGAAGVAWDNTIGQGLYDMHARTYHPALGRFLQPDPARADGNLYAYAGTARSRRATRAGLRPGNWVTMRRRIPIPLDAHLALAEIAAVNYACSRVLAWLPDGDGRVKAIRIAVQVTCFLASLRITASMDRLQLEGSYNQKTGAVYFSWTYLVFHESAEVWAPDGRTHVESWAQGGRTCLLALMGYSNPYNATFCR